MGTYATTSSNSCAMSFDMSAAWIDDKTTHQLNAPTIYRVVTNPPSMVIDAITRMFHQPHDRGKRKVGGRHSAHHRGGRGGGSGARRSKYRRVVWDPTAPLVDKRVLNSANHVFMDYHFQDYLDFFEYLRSDAQDRLGSLYRATSHSMLHVITSAFEGGRRYPFSPDEFVTDLISSHPRR